MFLICALQTAEAYSVRCKHVYFKVIVLFPFLLLKGRLNKQGMPAFALY